MCPPPLPLAGAATWCTWTSQVAGAPAPSVTRTGPPTALPVTALQRNPLRTNTRSNALRTHHPHHEIALSNPMNRRCELDGRWEAPSPCLHSVSTQGKTPKTPPGGHPAGEPTLHMARTTTAFSFPTPLQVLFRGLVGSCGAALPLPEIPCGKVGPRGQMKHCPSLGSLLLSACFYWGRHEMMSAQEGGFLSRAGC